MRPYARRGFCPVRGGTVLAILIFFAPALSYAETWKGLELERKMQSAPWHFGPFRIQPSIIIANAGVDSNIYYSPTDPVKDFTLTAGPAATFYLPIHRKFVLWAYGSPQYVWYSKTAQERTWNYYLNGAAQLNLKNVFLSLEGLYTDARERWNTEIDIRPRRIEEGYGGSALVKLAWKTSFSLGYRTAQYDYQSLDTPEGFNVRQELNRQESYANLSLFHQSGKERRFFLDLEYGQYRFEFDTTAALKNSDSAAAYAGLEFSQLGRRVRGRIRIGYKKFDILNAGAPDFRGVVGDSLLSLRLAKPFVLRVSYVRDVRFSLWYDNPYYVESRPGAGVSVYLLRFLRLDYDYSRGKNDYPLAGGGGTDVKRFDVYTLHGTGLYVRIVKNAALGVIANWWARDSNIDAEDDQRTFFGLNLTYDF